MNGSLISNLLIFIRGNNHVLRINENCIIKEGVFWFEDNNCEIFIGCNTTIESAHFAVTEPNKCICIGQDCMLSSEIQLRTGDSHSIINDEKVRINMAQNISIGNHVWIGARSIILKGVSIGNNCIVGINSIVTKNIPDNSLVGGIPAKILKNNISWLRERIYIF